MNVQQASRFKTWQLVLLFVTGIFLAVGACKNDTPEPAPVLSITSFSPTTAPVSTTLTITGTNFNTTPASNIVTFGNVPATVNSATSTQLVVTVPTGATDGPISVSANGAKATSTANFVIGNKVVVSVSGELTGTINWTKDKVYLLKGYVYVTNGATLNIQAGTIIRGGSKADDPTGQQQAATLVIEKGGKINAIGTVAEPIVFTSNKPAGQRNYGDWGGVVLFGKAPHNQAGSTLAEGGIRGQLGTDNVPNDNSGTMQYVRIEFPGVALTGTTNSEINGLTLYAVGSGTTLDHIQVSYSGDDSYEWFGGTVNAKYLVALRGWDDDWDTDWGFSGKVQYGVALRDPAVADQSSSNGFESDNMGNPGYPAGTTPATIIANNGLPLTSAIFANMSNFVFSGTPVATASTNGSGPFQSGMHLRRFTSISIYNSLLAGYPEGLRLDGKANTTYANALSDKLDLRGVVIANTITPVRGADEITNDQAIAYFNDPARSNTIIASSAVATLLLNSASFNLTAPNFLPQAGSPLLTGAVKTGKMADAFFDKVDFRGAFGTVNWTTGWTNFDPQNTNYDK
ncbi:MAG: IPT/TIG domain-containing protein [Spirosoma sp.]|nr:IPT/TIG domain-containing protein [Spirosoma sp.]